MLMIPWLIRRGPGELHTALVQRLPHLQLQYARRAAVFAARRRPKHAFASLLLNGCTGIQTVMIYSRELQPWPEGEEYAPLMHTMLFMLAGAFQVLARLAEGSVLRCSAVTLLKGGLPQDHHTCIETDSRARR